MVDIKLFANNEKELETVILAIRILGKNIKMEFGIEKCTMLIMKNGKRETVEGIELPNQECIKTLREKKNCKYLGL